MPTFDTKIQYLKFQILTEVARNAWANTLLDNELGIPEKIVPGKEPTMRCCVYKERAILAERVKLAMGGNRDNPNIIEVIDIACDECPIGGYMVTNGCRGCLAHNCERVCPRKAIYFDSNHQAHIDKEKCVNCGLCAKACQYSAIVNRRRPCENACVVKAIETKDSSITTINNDKCTRCGACIAQCPFGAIQDKSFILDAIDYIIKSENNTKYKTIAIIAPAIANQIKEVSYGKIVSGIKALGFSDVVEVALGADMVAFKESEEWHEKGFLFSSCCPAFVRYIQTSYPALTKDISSNISPMGAVAKYLKEKHPDCKIVFIGPCTAKKAEIQLPSIAPYVDVAITFEELQALFASKDIDLSKLEDSKLDNASYFGRIFARSGGLTEAMKQGIKEHGYTDFEFKPLVCSGIDQCRSALLKRSKNVLDSNFVEGMACPGGCIGGAGVLEHFNINPGNIDKYGKEAGDKTISQAINDLK